MFPVSAMFPVSRSRWVRGAVTSIAAGVLTVGASVTMFAADVSSASSHREAPLIANDPQVDNTDVYAFVSPDKAKTTTLIANWYPFEIPAGGPNFFQFADDAHYDINIDNNGDGKPDIVYRWKFKTMDHRGTKTFLYNNGPVTSLNDPNLLVRQTYSLTKISHGKSQTMFSNAPVAPSNVGAASMPNYAGLRSQATVHLNDGVQSFAGQADDPFFLDLRIFDFLYGGNLSETGNNTLSGLNVQSVALQVPTSEITRGNDPVVGIWSTTERPSMRVQAASGSQAYNGKYVQVSRLGNPLVNEVVVPAGLKDAFNALPPVKDHTMPAVVDKVNNPEVPQLIQSIYKIKAPMAPRKDLVSIFLTGIKGLNMPKGTVTPAEMLRLNTSIPVSTTPNRLGVLGGDKAGFPNGRRLTDDVVDIELQALEGAVRTGKIVQPLAKGDSVNANDVPFNQTFPYLALPHSGSGTTSPAGGVNAGGGGTAPRGAASTAQSHRAVALSATQDRPIPMLPISLGVLGLGLAVFGVAALRRGRLRVDN